MREKSNTCCFTGHRDISALSYKELADRVEPLLIRLINNGYRYFVCGGAIGFDTFAATYICSLKKRGKKIFLVLMLPCRDQTAKWSNYDKLVYESILGYADEVIWLADKYYSGCMQKRNRAMVDASSACICYLNSMEHSGTRQTVEYAMRQGISIVNVAT
ncbi:MAG: DUF1273 family protein [Clostridia bacterium]|nr:DUF1273 family protein [Clostridia bacterium]